MRLLRYLWYRSETWSSYGWAVFLSVLLLVILGEAILAAFFGIKKDFFLIFLIPLFIAVQTLQPDKKDADLRAEELASRKKSQRYAVLTVIVLLAATVLIGTFLIVLGSLIFLFLDNGVPINNAFGYAIILATFTVALGYAKINSLMPTAGRKEVPAEEKESFEITREHHKPRQKLQASQIQEKPSLEINTFKQKELHQFSRGIEETLQSLSGEDKLRYLLWILPLVIVAIYWVVIKGLGFPILFALMTLGAVYYAVYPVECARHRLLTKSFFYEEAHELPVIAYAIIAVEVVFIGFSAQMFSCDCLSVSNATFWWRGLFFLYLSFALLWVQTNGFRECEYGVRRFYYKTAFFIGILYSLLVIVSTTQDFKAVWSSYDAFYNEVAEAAMDIASIAERTTNDTIALGKEIYNEVEWKEANGLKRGVSGPLHRLLVHRTSVKSEGEKLFSNLQTSFQVPPVSSFTEVLNLGDFWEKSKEKNGIICAAMSYFNNVANLVAARFPPWLSYVLMTMININVLVGVMFATHLMVLVRVYVKIQSAVTS